MRPRAVLRGPVQPSTAQNGPAELSAAQNRPQWSSTGRHQPVQPRPTPHGPPQPSPSRPVPSRPVPSGLSSRQRRAPGATCRNRGSAPAPRAQLQLPVPSSRSQLGLWVPPAEQEQGLGGYARLCASVSPLPKRGTAGGRQGAGPAAGTGLVPVTLPRAWGMPQSCPGPFQAGLGCSCTYKVWPAPSTWPARQGGAEPGRRGLAEGETPHTVLWGPCDGTSTPRALPPIQSSPEHPDPPPQAPHSPGSAGEAPPFPPKHISFSRH